MGKCASFFNKVQNIPLPTPQARARGSRQFKQVVVVDIAVVVVLVEVVVDLYLFNLGKECIKVHKKKGSPVGKEQAAPGTTVATVKI